jgi:hypothetical protein
VRQAIQVAEGSASNHSAQARLKTLATSLETSAATAKSAADAKRLHGLAEILNNPAR